jgi:hypothetical protein
MIVNSGGAVFIALMLLMTAGCSYGDPDTPVSNTGATEVIMEEGALGLITDLRQPSHT